MDYSTMTKTDLHALNNQLSDRRDEIRTEQKQIAGALNAIEAKEKAERLMGAMNDSEKEALRQVVNAAGIDSEESVGAPAHKG